MFDRWFVKVLLGLLILSAIFGLGRRRPRLFFAGLAAPIMTSPSVGSSFEISCGPRFNQFPVSYIAQNYRDWPLIDGRNMTKGRSWSNSQEEHDRGIEADPGDVIEIFIYFQNGGLTDDCEGGSALHVTIQSEVSPALGQLSLSHRIS